LRLALTLSLLIDGAITNQDHGIEMKRILKLAAALSIVAIASGCAGTGTRDVGQINTMLAEADGNTAFVLRSTGFAGSAVPIEVLQDGVVVESLSVNEVGEFKAEPGEHTLTLDFKGIDIGLTTKSLQYVNDPNRPQYFVISLTQRFMTAELSISEVSPQSFQELFRR
jgi:hypothetical protein